MSRSIRISMQNPCHEKWENFTPTVGGAFCQSCYKDVTDFTKMTDAEIIEFLKRKPINSCGRFRPEQLKEYSMTGNNSITIKPSRLLHAALISLLAFVSKPTMAQTTSPEPIVEQTLSQKLKHSSDGNRSISGIVVDSDGIPIPGVNVVVSGINMGTVTDADGRFELPNPIKESQTITFSFIGYKTHTVLLNSLDGNYVRLRLEIDTLVLGGDAVIVGGYVGKRSLLSRVKSWFR